ncbi:unnamed protein product [Closterium sp. Naga37s-1]|nr:unnamed protein product [Closterium sp. Naga37s-1]
MAGSAVAVGGGKSEEELRREIEEIERQQAQVEDSLRTITSRLPPSIRRTLPPAPPAIRGQSLRAPRRFPYPGGASDPAGGGGGRAGGLSFARRTQSDAALPDGDVAGGTKRRRLMSAVTRVGPDGEPIDPIEPRRTTHDVPADTTAPPPPPAPASAPPSSPGALPLPAHEPAPAPPRPVVQLDPVARRRHRNMLGALLVGTLQRAREEEERDAELLARRAMIQQKAEQRVAEQSERLKEQERERILQQRKRDLVLRARLMAKAEEKEVHLLARHWQRHRSRLSHFIRTQASPPIMYLPARPSPATDKLLQAQAQSLEEWQQQQEREVQQLVADSLQRHLAEADRLMLPQGGDEGQAVGGGEAGGGEGGGGGEVVAGGEVVEGIKATKGEKGAGSDSDDQRMNSVEGGGEERDERKEGSSEVRVKEEKVADPDGEPLNEAGVDGEGKGEGLEEENRTGKGSGGGGEESSGVQQQHAEEASGGKGGAREEGLRDDYRGDEVKEEGVEERGEEARRERGAGGDKGREKAGEGREKGGEVREKGGEGREKGGEGREKGGEGREKGGEGRRRSPERRSPGRRVPRTRSPHSRSPQRRSSQRKGTERRSGGSPSSSSSGGREASRHRG